MAAALVVATSTLVLPASAHAGGPPNNGDGGGGGSAAVTPGSCADGDLAVTNGPIESANTLRRVVVSFKNTSSNMCMLVGYPDANLVTAAGGVLVHVEPEPANAAHVLHLNPGDVATSAVQASALDINGSGNPCPREGTLVVTAPKGSVAHTLPIALPICHATISSVD
ncbi:hypothetical protein MCOO_17540 [Mycobacterium cookii]|uniref:DUF4232 domain-containing protein n=1 Tax=Mycobacterium cookii TaxID=1775 RepID=A0A7I7KVK8_9MYCO|nr:hypothetical protein MCOO_17540 [Mycobacterium cookii]